MKQVLVLGSTGSIGVNTLNVIREFPDMFRASVLTVNSNIDLVEKQFYEFRPDTIVVTNKRYAAELRNRLNGSVEILDGNEGLIEITKRGNYDILLSALVGFAGLAPTLEAIKLGKRIALANKETLVAAGELVIEQCKKHSAELIPVDSEHSAIFQCLAGEKSAEVNKLILTASGGPFYKKTQEELLAVTREEALNHPNWKMGNKITIDSATMMNKGLEVIEARWLFDIPQEKINVVIHPQSIIHSMVEFVDGSIKAQLSNPDMKLPIQYAMTYPARFKSNFVNTDFCNIGSLTFFRPDSEKFRCLKLAFDSMAEGGTSTCILNAANEIAVQKFLEGSIKFHQIPDLISDALLKMENHKRPDIETIFECDKETREFLRNRIN